MPIITSPKDPYSATAELDPSLADQPNGTVRGVFEPPRGPVLTGLSRNKLLIFVVAVLCAIVGLGIGAARKGTYTASATLQVGQVNPNSPGFNGYVQSATSLAAAFSRAIGAEQVLSTIQHKLNVTPARANARLSAEPLPLTPAFRVIATGASQANAIRLANVAAQAVVEYESSVNSANPEANSILHEYREASVELQRSISAIANLVYANRKKGTSEGELIRNDKLATAEADKQAAQAKLKALGASYTAAVTSKAPRTGLVSLLAGATSATSNKHSKIELYGFVGLLVGVVLGALAAVLRERVRLKRRLATMVEAEIRQPGIG
jgi:capsular polysaccharide biosynthesis protein